MIAVVMGVCGCGKSTVGQRLAEDLEWEFRDGDGFHPPENVSKMSKGTPLTDADRDPWLAAIRKYMEETNAQGKSAVVACSALKKMYRAKLGDAEPWVKFVHVHGDPAVIRARMLARKDHFMPPTLLDSQLATLETPIGAVVVDVALTTEEQVKSARKGLGV